MQEIIVNVHDVDFTFDKNQLGELYISMTVDGTEQGGYIAGIRDLQLSDAEPDVRLFDFFGNQNYFECRYTTAASRGTDSNRIPIIPRNAEEMRKLVLDNKEKIVRQFLINEVKCHPFYATVIGKETELVTYLQNEEFGYGTSHNPIVKPLKDILSNYEEDNKKLFEMYGQVNLYKFQDDRVPTILHYHKDILKVLEIPEFVIKI